MRRSMTPTVSIRGNANTHKAVTGSHHRRLATLRQGNQQPGKDETEEHAAVVAEKDARARISRVAQVEEQEAHDSTHQGHGHQEVGRVAASLGDDGNERQADETHRTRQPVDPVDHVDRVDQTDGRENGDRHAEPAEIDRNSRQQFTERSHLHAADEHHRQRDESLHDEPRS
jgi:hypothetical protein